nr:hypothetical protein CFP56_67336 [Quercus suber]
MGIQCSGVEGKGRVGWLWLVSASNIGGAAVARPQLPSDNTCVFQIHGCAKTLVGILQACMLIHALNFVNNPASALGSTPVSAYYSISASPTEEQEYMQISAHALVSRGERMVNLEELEQ